jgi:signal transduction histidine kinase
MNHDKPWGTTRGRVELLVLEDNPADAGLLDAEFKGEVLIDACLTIAPRLSDGLRLLASREFDAVLLNLDLPDSQGMETFERLRAAVPQVPLIVYSGIHDDETALRALHAAQIQARNVLLEELVRERTAELVVANSEVEAFANSVSHDLRAPLRHIKGFTQMLEEQAGAGLDASAQALLARILRSVEQMRKLIDDLLGFSRLGNCPVSRQPVALGPLVTDVIEELAPEAQGRPVEWCVNGLPSLDADPSLLRVVLVNLLSNALKFTRGRDPARIEVFPAGNHSAPVIAVRDNGIGFAAEDAGRLFGVFQRLHTQSEFEGTGVGLATVKRIITRHGGRIWAEALPGVGATFFFSLGPGETQPARPS